MQFLWKSQLRKERGKLLPKSSGLRSKPSRKENLASHHGDHGSYGGVLFLWFLFLGTLVYVVFFSPYLFITQTNISGAPSAEAESLELFVEQGMEGKHLWIFPKKDFFLIYPHRLEGKIKSEFPLVRTVTVKRIFPHTLDVRIEAREKLVIWCAGSTCSHLLEDGSVVPKSEVFEREVNKSETLTIRDTSEKMLPIGESIFSPAFVPFVISLPGVFMSRLGIEVENTFTVSSRFAEELRVKTKEGWEVYISTERSLESSLDALGLVLEKEIPADKRPLLKYVDLRTENRIYYVFQEGAGISGEMSVVGEEQKTEKKEAEKPKKR